MLEQDGSMVCSWLMREDEASGLLHWLHNSYNNFEMQICVLLVWSYAWDHTTLDQEDLGGVVGVVRR